MMTMETPGLIFLAAHASAGRVPRPEIAGWYLAITLREGGAEGCA